MTPARVTNRSDQPLAIAGVSIGPGRTVMIKNWVAHKGSDNVVAWLAAKAIEVEEEAVEAPEPTPKAKKPAAKKPETPDGIHTPDGGGL